MRSAHGDQVRVFYNPNFVIRTDAPIPGKVGIVSGGGSGHEPMHIGFVGKGMLDAACPGEVFTSPTPDQIEAATKAVNGQAGILHIVKNYSIPAVTGTDAGVKAITPGTILAVDGFRGILWIAPPPEIIAEMNTRKTGWMKQRREFYRDRRL